MNVLTLGMSFISGVFVPQAILGKTVLTIAQFTPVFWFVKANIAIESQIDFSGQALQDILFAC
jgi:ABC-2 type transport system permease protein